MEGLSDGLGITARAIFPYLFCIVKVYISYIFLLRMKSVADLPLFLHLLLLRVTCVYVYALNQAL